MLICSHNRQEMHEAHQTNQQSQRENGNMYEGMTTSINQYTEKIEQFQSNEYPTFEKVYIRLRKLLFDFFGTTVEVISSALQIGFVLNWTFYAVVRFEHCCDFSTKIFNRT